MPVTYNLIASNTLSSAAASVTFSAIPGTYTDLVLKVSSRTTSTGSRLFGVRYNGSTTTVYSYTELQGDGASATSSRINNNNGDETTNAQPNANDTTNTFSSIELYLPSYTVSQNRVASIDTVQETNATTAYRKAHASLYRDTTAITSLDFYTSGNFVAGSSFFLYGIKNS